MSTTAELLAAADALADICEQSPCGACPPDDPCGQCCEDAAVARYRALRAAVAPEPKFNSGDAVYIRTTLRSVFSDGEMSHNVPTFVRHGDVIPAAEVDGARWRAGQLSHSNGDWLVVACRAILEALESPEDDIERARRLVGNSTHPSAESPPPLTP